MLSESSAQQEEEEDVAGGLGLALELAVDDDEDEVAADVFVNTAAAVLSEVLHSLQLLRNIRRIIDAFSGNEMTNFEELFYLIGSLFCGGPDNVDAEVLRIMTQLKIVMILQMGYYKTDPGMHQILVDTFLDPMQFPVLVPTAVCESARMATNGTDGVFFDFRVLYSYIKRQHSDLLAIEQRYADSEDISEYLETNSCRKLLQRSRRTLYSGIVPKLFGLLCDPTADERLSAIEFEHMQASKKQKDEILFATLEEEYSRADAALNKLLKDLVLIYGHFDFAEILDYFMRFVQRSRVELVIEDAKENTDDSCAVAIIPGLSKEWARMCFAAAFQYYEIPDSVLPLESYTMASGTSALAATDTSAFGATEYRSLQDLVDEFGDAVAFQTTTRILPGDVIDFEDEEDDSEDDSDDEDEEDEGH